MSQSSRDADLLAWSVNFSAKITATPTSYGFTSIQAGAYAALHAAFATAYATATKLWLTAFWFNNRKQTGPAATPTSTRISDGLAQAA